MGTVGWLRDGSEGSLRAALGAVVPELAELPLAFKPRQPQSNPSYWSASAVVGDGFVVKYAWSEVRAVRLWREGVVLGRLRAQDALLAIPELVAVSREPALVVTRLVVGEPLSREWASAMTGSETDQVGQDLGRFLARLHDVAAEAMIGDLPVVHPTPQADTERLREDFMRLVDERRGRLVLRWCDWVDDVLRDPVDFADVVVHGDLHGYNQVWNQAASKLLAVVDFEEAGIADPHFDLRYLAGNAQRPQLLLSVMQTYERCSGRRLALDRSLAWHVLTVLGDALWRTEAGADLPGGGSPEKWVDDLAATLHTLGFA